MTDGPDLWVSHTGHTLAVGDEVPLEARVHLHRNALVEEVRQGFWSVRDTEVARVEGGSRLVAVSPGRTTVEVEYRGARDTATVVVRDPTDVDDTRWSQVSVDEYNVCAITTDGMPYCWGSDYYANLGSGERRQWTSAVAPVRVQGGPYVEIATGSWHACGLTVDGSPECWGDNFGSAAGTGGNTPRYLVEPVPVATDLRFVSISTGPYHTVGLSDQGEVLGWGSNYSGQIGDGGFGTDGMRFAPSRAAADVVFTEVRTGRYHTCALDDEGAAFCWGANHAGTTGQGYADPDPHVTPAQVMGDVRFASLHVGYANNCGLTEEGSAYCWGANTGLQLGEDAEDRVTAPRHLSMLESFTAIAFGDPGTACGVTATGEAFCWGMNRDGALGTDAALPHTCGAEPFLDPCTGEPVRVQGDVRFQMISTEKGTTCGITTSGELYCWGSNHRGRLGIGRADVEASALPRRIAPPL